MHVRHHGSELLRRGNVRGASADRAPSYAPSCSPIPRPRAPRGNGEGEFVFWRGELLAGCLDKAQFGKFGLVHAMQVRRWVGG